MAIEPVVTELRRKAATATTFCFQTDGDTSQNWSAGDVKVYRHTGGSWANANISTLPSTIVPGITGMVTYNVPLTATEMTTDDTKYPIIVAFDNGSAWLAAYIYTEAQDSNIIEINGDRTDGNNARLKLESIDIVSTTNHGINVETSANLKRGISLVATGTNSYGLYAKGKTVGIGAVNNDDGGYGLYTEGKEAAIYAKNNNGVAIDVLSSGNSINVVSSGGHGINIDVAGNSKNGIDINATGTQAIGIKSSGTTTGIHADGTSYGIHAQGDDIGLLGEGAKGIVGSGLGTYGIQGIGAEIGILGEASNVDPYGGTNGPGIKGLGIGSGAGMELVKGTTGKDIDADEIDNIKTDTEAIIVDTTSIENKVDIIDTNVDTSLVNQTDIENKVDIIDTNVDTSLTNQTSIENKINTIDNNVDTSLTNQTSIENKIDVIDNNIDNLNDISVADILAGTVDGQTVSYIFELVKASVNGKYSYNTPTTGQLTFYKDDNTTVLTIVDIAALGRTKVS